MTKTCFKCPPEYKSEFPSSHCSLTISVGQPQHEGTKLLATIKAINSSFESCTIMICDTLQRHTIAAQTNQSSEELHQATLDEGDAWLQRNKAILAQFEIPYTTMRWDFWLGHHEFKTQKEKLHQHYENCAEFKTAMKTTIDSFAERFRKRSDTFDYEKIFTNSFNYLIEECAAQILWIPHQLHFEIYPTERNPILSCCYEQFIKPFYPEVLRPIALKFKKSAATPLLNKLL